MLDPDRRLPIILWIALHASLTLCGPGLHAVWGADHGGMAVSPGERSSSAGTRGEAETTALVEVGDGGDDCPICSFLAQGQLHVQKPPISTGHRLAFAEATPGKTPPTPPEQPPSSPRAPPRPSLERV